MQTTVTERGQTSIPSEIRKHLGIKPGQRLEWMEDGPMIRVMPVPDDPIAAFRGSAKGKGYLQALLASRAEDRRRERTAAADQERRRRVRRRRKRGSYLQSELGLCKRQLPE